MILTFNFRNNKAFEARTRFGPIVGASGLLLNSPNSKLEGGDIDPDGPIVVSMIQNHAITEQMALGGTDPRWLRIENDSNMVGVMEPDRVCYWWVPRTFPIIIIIFPRRTDLDVVSELRRANAHRFIYT